MNPPPYISLIQDGWIRIQGEFDSIPELAKLVAQIPFGYVGVLFAERGDYFKNVSLIETLMKVNAIGVAFGEDYKQIYSPAEFMRELQARAILKEDFRSIYWTGLDLWHLKTNPAEQGGRA